MLLIFTHFKFLECTNRIVLLFHLFSCDKEKLMIFMNINHRPIYTYFSRGSSLCDEIEEISYE